MRQSCTRAARMPAYRAEVRVIFGHVCLQELVTELVSRHLVVTCYRVVSDLLPTCNPRFWPKDAL